jgi:hypothetical protein
MYRLLVPVLLCVAAVSIVGNLGAVLAWLRARSTDAAPGDRVVTAVEVQRTPDKLVVIKLSPRTAESYGIETEVARPGTWDEGVVVFGRVVTNPRVTFELRSPYLGTLQAVGDDWPTPGRTVKPGQPLVRVIARLAPQERLDLQMKLDEAQQKKKGAEAVVKLRQALVDRLKPKVEANTIPRKELEDAEVTLLEAQTQLAIARNAVETWERSLGQLDKPISNDGPWTRTLTAPEVAGDSVLEVVDIAGQSGSPVDSGGLVVRLTDVRRPLIRLDIPPEVLRDGPPPAEIELEPAATPPVALQGALNRPELPPGDAPVRATLVGPAATVEGSSQLVGYAYALQIDSADPRGLTRTWRPGMFAQARLTPGGMKPMADNAVSVPAAAILYHQGRALVYRRIELPTDEQKPGDRKWVYEHREVQVLGFRGDRCLLAPWSPLSPALGVREGDLVVSSQAQVLLSAEFRRDSDDD